jgi:Ca2+-binding EF-hand superfamily protein
LSEDEIKQAAKATSADPADQQKALDKDGDGKLSGDELAEAAKTGKLPPAELKKLDKDGDGKLSPDELEQGAKEANTKAAAAAPKEKMKSAMKKKFKSPEEAMKTMDTDGDGKISPEEMEQGLKDQGVSPDEAKKMAKDLDFLGLLVVPHNLVHQET